MGKVDRIVGLSEVGEQIVKDLPARNTKIVTRYLHHDSDELDVDIWPDVEAPQHEKFHYALYEVRIDLEVDLDTGESRIIAVDDIPLTEPRKFT